MILSLPASRGGGGKVVQLRWISLETMVTPRALRKPTATAAGPRVAQ